MNTENNKSMAEFRGATFKENEFRFPTIVFKTGKNYFENHELKFHSDWNWLMEVVEKIEKLDFRVSITEFSTNIGNEKLKISQWQAKTKIENCYNACLEFIKWYNEQKKV